MSDELQRQRARGFVRVSISHIITTCFRHTRLSTRSETALHFAISPNIFNESLEWSPVSVWDHRVRQRSSYHLLEGRHVTLICSFYITFLKNSSIDVSFHTFLPRIYFSAQWRLSCWILIVSCLLLLVRQSCMAELLWCSFCPDSNLGSDFGVGGICAFAVLLLSLKFGCFDPH